MSFALRSCLPPLLRRAAVFALLNATLWSAAAQGLAHPEIAQDPLAQGQGPAFAVKPKVLSLRLHPTEDLGYAVEGLYCEGRPVSAALTPQHVLYTVDLESPAPSARGRRAPNCSGDYSQAQLQTAAGPLKFVGIFGATGQRGTSADVPPGGRARHTLVFQRGAASEADVAEGAINALSAPTFEEFERSRSQANSIHVVDSSWTQISAVLVKAEARRVAEASQRAQTWAGADGIPRYIASLKPNEAPDHLLLAELFKQVPPMGDNACTRGVAQLIGQLHQTAKNYGDPLGRVLSSLMPEAKWLAASMATVPDSENTVHFPIRVVTDSACQEIYVQMLSPLSSGYGGSRYHGRRTTGMGAWYIHLRAPALASHRAGLVLLSSERLVSENMPPRVRTWAQRVVSFVCTPKDCREETLADAVRSGRANPADDWSLAQRAEIQQLAAAEAQKQAEADRQRRQYEAEVAERRRVAEAQAQREREAANRQAQAEEKAFKAVLAGNDAQAMYLAAGKYQRNSESYRAVEIYERIVSRFASSPWAVKASDQLNAMDRQSRSESAARQSERAARERAESSAREERLQCGVRISRCKDQCPSSGTARQSCQAQCTGLCREF